MERSPRSNVPAIILFLPLTVKGREGSVLELFCSWHCSRVATIWADGPLPLSLHPSSVFLSTSSHYGVTFDWNHNTLCVSCISSYWSVKENRISVQSTDSLYRSHIHWRIWVRVRERERMRVLWTSLLRHKQFRASVTSLVSWLEWVSEWFAWGMIYLR